MAVRASGVSKFSHILFSCCQAGQGRYPLPRLQPFVMKDTPPPPPPPTLAFPFLTGVLRTRPPSECTVFCHVRHVAPNPDSLPRRPLGWMTFVTPILVVSLGGLGPSGAPVSAGSCGKCLAAHIGKICKLVNHMQHVMGIHTRAGVNKKLWLINTKPL